MSFLTAKRSESYAHALSKMGLRIRFRDPDIEDEFRQHWRFQANSQFTVALPLAAALLILFGVYEFFTLEGQARDTLMLLRVVLLVPFLALTSAMIYIERLRTHATPIAIGLALVTGLVISTMVIAARYYGIDKPYQGIIFAIFYCFFFCRLLTQEATFVSAGISLFYFTGLYFTGISSEAFANQCIWFVAAIIIGFAACRSNERYARKSFLQTQIINNFAESDSLTGLSNRHYFDTTYQNLVDDANRQGNSVAVMMLDVDHFKEINDEHGHQIGDEILKQAGFALRTATHTNPKLIARYGGDEFIAVWVGQAKSDVMQIAQTLRLAIRRACRKSDITVGTSAGVAWSYPPVDGAKLISQADEALYSAKGAGRDCLMDYNEPEPNLRLASSFGKKAAG